MQSITGRIEKCLIMVAEQNGKNKREKVNIFDDRAPLPHLPEELFTENILIRLPARILAICSCVSKLWYNSILNDSRFATNHLVHHKNNKLNLVFNLLNVPNKRFERAYFLGLEEKDNNHNNDIDGETLNYRLLISVSFLYTNELVGYCNGLACIKLVSETASIMTVINPTRGETLCLSYVTPTKGKGEGSCRYLCHGFGFDTSSQKYKVVFVYTTTSSTTATNNEDEEFVSMVFTLGERNSCRKIVTNIAQISPAPGSSPFPSPMGVRASRITRRTATLCGGDLFWRITTSSTDDIDNKINMLLSFDIHSEKIQLIRLPTECNLTSTTTTTTNEHQCLVVDHHLLEYKGNLCVARSEKIMISKSHHSHHHHLHHHCNGQSSLCCCCIKVHIFALKDKVKQVWTKGETFNIQIKEEGLLPPPFCCYFDSTTAPPPTRILSFSDQLSLYWFDGEYLIFYNLQMKHLKVVKCSSSSDERSRDIFETKMQKGICPGRVICDDDNSKFPYMDYQLHAQVENMLSLKTFIPRGEVSAFNCYEDSISLSEIRGRNLQVW